MNYDEMSDFEINRLAAGKLGYAILPYTEDECLGRCGRDSCYLYGPQPTEFDPCNNPQDAWPIILENKISITWTGSYWVSAAPLSHSLNTSQTDDRPLRSAMIVFIKMEAYNLSE